MRPILPVCNVENPARLLTGCGCGVKLSARGIALRENDMDTDVDTTLGVLAKAGKEQAQKALELLSERSAEVRRRDIHLGDWNDATAVAIDVINCLQSLSPSLIQEISPARKVFRDGDPIGEMISDEKYYAMTAAELREAIYNTGRAVIRTTEGQYELIEPESRDIAYESVQ
jgi:hypothetical protein